MSLYFNNSLYKFNNRPVQQVVTIPIIKKKRKRKKKEKEVVTDNKLLLLILKELKKKKNPKKTKKKKKKGKRFKKNRYGLGKSKPIISPQKPGETDDEYKRRIVIQELSIKNPLLSILADNMNNSNILPIERINEIEQLISNPLSELRGLDKLKNLFNELDETQKVSFKNTPLGRRLNNELVSKIPREDFSNNNDFETLLKQDIRNKQQVKDRELRSRVSPINATDTELNTPLNMDGNVTIEEIETEAENVPSRGDVVLSRNEKQWTDKDTGDEEPFYKNRYGYSYSTRDEYLNSLPPRTLALFEKKLRNKTESRFKPSNEKNTLSADQIQLNKMLDEERKINRAINAKLIRRSSMTSYDEDSDLTPLEIARNKLRLERRKSILSDGNETGEVWAGGSRPTTEDEFLQARVSLREKFADIED